MEEETNIDGRTREGRALKAAGTGKESPADSKARAEARIRALRGNPDLIDGGGERDKYWAPPAPEGWDYQWKLKSVMGQDDIDRIRSIELAGWEPVPLSRHPELMPKNWKGETIEVGGLVLMERPKMFTDEARQEEARAAREAVLTREAQMKDGRAGDLGRREVQRFSKSHERIAVPND
jgi:hypothetical protein